MQKNCWIFPTTLNRALRPPSHLSRGQIDPITALPLPGSCYLESGNEQDELSHSALIRALFCCNVAQIHCRLKASLIRQAQESLIVPIRFS